MTSTSPSETLVFQDVVRFDREQGLEKSQEQLLVNDDHELSLAFFELANVPIVGYRLPSKQQRKFKKASTMVVTVHQDIKSCGNHTGGIVWETSYLLLNYLLNLLNRNDHDKNDHRRRLGNVLEVGSGCGLVGLVLAASGWFTKVVLTEADEVLPNLKFNLECFHQTMDSIQKKKRRNNKKHKVNEKNVNLLSKTSISVQRLDWRTFEADATGDLLPHSFDLIVGTDVVFVPSLVEPLLQTLQFMSHDATVVYLCVQIRCPDSHELLLQKAVDYQWSVQDVSQEEFSKTPECVWGLAMECHLLRFSRANGSTARSHTTTEEVDVNDRIGIKVKTMRMKKRKRCSEETLVGKKIDDHSTTGKKVKKKTK